VSRNDAAQYREHTEQEIRDEFGEECASYRPPFHEQLFELGKYVDYSKHCEPFYAHIEGDEDLFLIMDKEGLAAIIEDYRQQTADYMAEMLARTTMIAFDGAEQAEALKKEGLKQPGTEYDTDENIIYSFFFRMHQEWVRGRDFGLTPFYLNEPQERRDGQVVSSWQIQYAVLNLVYIYNTFNWEEDVLIYSGW
jgi:hypothetical protein